MGKEGSGVGVEGSGSEGGQHEGGNPDAGKGAGGADGRGCMLCALRSESVSAILYT